jgi:cyclopropane-fatty-acyl-phospholipid synthase
MISETIRELLANAGVTVNGPNPWDIRVADDRFYGRVWRQGSLGFGEAYMDGWWDCPRVDELVFRLLAKRADLQVGGWLHRALQVAPHLLFNLQAGVRARIIAERHYDLGNDLFFSFLDPHLQYSCAYFDGTDDLALAQENKLKLIATKLGLRPGDHLLDIGCGWGGLAKYAAERHGCTVTGVNISREQLRHARESCRGLPVTFLEADYRAITGTYDKIVSVGMFEHVGSKNHATYMRVARRCLADHGIFLLHTIGANLSGRGGCDPWISRHIFPNSMLPSPAQVSRAAGGRFVIEDWHNLAPHYDRTLMAWNANFQAAWPRLAGRYDARFKRMWEYYLLSCAGAFRARSIQVWQIVMTADGTAAPHPDCRPAPDHADDPRNAPSQTRGPHHASPHSVRRVSELAGGNPARKG